MATTHMQYQIERGRRGGWELQCMVSGGTDRRPVLIGRGHQVACRAAGSAADADHTFRRHLAAQHPSLAAELADPTKTLVQCSVVSGRDELRVVAILTIE